METFVGDNVTLRLETGIDVSAYSVNRIKYVKPDGETGYWNAAADPSDHTVMQRAMDDGELDVRGTWLVQAYVQEGNTIFHGLWAEFKVFNPLPIR